MGNSTPSIVPTHILIIIILHIAENVSLELRNKFKNQKIDTEVSSAFGSYYFDWWNHMVSSGYTEYHMNQSGEKW